jgi:hypothetical protein
VIALMTNAGLSDARTTGDRTLLAGFIRIAYYQSEGAHLMSLAKSDPVRLALPSSTPVYR